jgi:rare lipoprotein A
MKKSLNSVLAIAMLSSAIFMEPSESTAEELREPVVRTLSGVASWYGGRFHGRKTANGERYDMHKLTAAHKSLPFGTKVRVTNSRNGKSVVVRINDRGPFVCSRVIDLSRGAASAVGMIEAGVARVRLEILS